MRPGATLFAARRFECRSDAPILEGFARRWLDVDKTGRLLLAEDAQEDAAAVKKGMRFVEMRTANRQVPGVDFTDDRERLAGRQRQCLPGMLVPFRQPYLFAAGFGADGHNVPGKVAYQVAAGNPRRQRKALAGRIGRRNAAAHFKGVCLNAQGRDGIVDRWGVHAWMCGEGHRRIVLSIPSHTSYGSRNCGSRLDAGRDCLSRKDGSFEKTWPVQKERFKLSHYPES